MISRLRRFLYRISVPGQFAANGIAVITGVALELPPAKHQYWILRKLAWVAGWMASHALLMFAIAGLIGFFGYIFRRLGNPTTYNDIQFLLDKFQEQLFPNGDDIHHHRVTLFKYQRFWVGYWLSPSVRADHYLWPWGEGAHPWSGWLVPIMRSGHTSRRMTSAFLASKSHPEKTEGVAGMAWTSKSTITVRRLPIVGSGSKDSVKNIYARKTKLPRPLVDRYAARGTPAPRSLGAFPVEVEGKLWGVLVLDSQSPDTIDDEIISPYTITVAMIARLLQRRTSA